MLTTMPKLDLSHLPRPLHLSRLSWLQLGLVFGGSALAFWKLAGCWATWSRNAKIRALIKKRRAERDEVIRKLKTQLNAPDVKVLEKRKWIIGLPTKELADKLKKEELKPVEVLEAFQSAALLAHEKTNCVTQFIVEARSWSQQLEQQYEGRDDKPPLFGLPFSVKEHMGVKGYDSTGGLGQFLFDPLAEDSALVIRLRQLGAVPFVMTNLPQTILSFNCSNPIYGSTRNPQNPVLSSGGSSGGEGALLGMRGSSFGLGSDLAGSIRVPAHFCGITGFKPTSNRISQMGGRKAMVGRCIISSSWGPMANDVDTLVMFMEEVLKKEFFAMDTNVVPVPFRRDTYESDRKLTIGYYDYDGYMEAAPACRRAVHVAKDILERNGHRLVKFTPPNVEKMFNLASKVMFLDAGHLFSKIMSKDLIDPNLRETYNWFSLPIWTRRLIARATALMGHTKKANFLNSFEMRTRELGYALADLFQCKYQFHAEWRRLGLDAVICPPCASVAMPEGLPARAMAAFMYTLLYNMVDYPGGIVPVTKVTAQDEMKTAKEYGADEYFAKMVYQANKQGTVGLSVGVQCAASTYNDEIVLRVMKEVEQGVRNTKA